jgi:hypothetical protein
MFEGNTYLMALCSQLKLARGGALAAGYPGRPGTGCLVRWFDSNNNVLRFAPIAIYVIRPLFDQIDKISRFTDILV